MVNFLSIDNKRLNTSFNPVSNPVSNQVLKYLSDLNSLISKSASSITRYDVIERDNQYISLLLTFICTLFGITTGTPPSNNITTLLTQQPVITSQWITNNIKFTDMTEPFETLESIRDKISKPPRNINIQSSLINLLKPLLEESKKNYVLKKYKSLLLSNFGNIWKLKFIISSFIHWFGNKILIISF